MRNQNMKLRSYLTIGMLSSISFLLMLIKFPLPWFPVFLQIDFSDVPPLIAAITMGPIAGILVEFFKNLLDWIFSGTPTGVPVGHMANFATGILFILPVYYIYKKFNSVKGLIAGLVVGTFVMSVGMGVLNYFVFLPMYSYFLNYDMGDHLLLAVTGILPFNIIKGILLMFVALVLFRMMKAWIQEQRAQYLLQK